MAKTKEKEVLINIAQKENITLIVNFREFEDKNLLGFSSVSLLDKSIEKGKGQLIEQFNNFKVVKSNKGNIFVTEPVRYDEKNDKTYPHYKAPQILKDVIVKIIKSEFLK